MVKIIMLSCYLLALLVPALIAAENEGRELIKRYDDGINSSNSMCCQDGRDGLPGLTGRDGPPGLTGRDGLNGQDGLPGLTGRDGPKGEPGQEGLRGEPGLAGSKGEQGPAGLQGLTGTEGSKGEPGQEGLTGEPGLAGSKGEQGPAGLQGVTGAKGSKGEAGQYGSTGPQGPPGASAPTTGGATYVRWGRTICPSITGTTLVYSGWAAGSHYSHSGSGANYVCLTKTPQYLAYNSETNNLGTVYGAEYEVYSNQPHAGVHNQNVPCVVCHVQQRSVLMMPGQYTCPTGWTREYYGYLVSERHNYHRSTYECMDVSPEAIIGGHTNQDGALFCHVEARCGSLACPPYEQTKELTCAVCSK